MREIKVINISKTERKIKVLVMPPVLTKEGRIKPEYLDDFKVHAK